MSQDKSKQQSLSGNKEDDDVAENGLHHSQPQPNATNSFLSGIKQRLLSFIFREIWNEESDNVLVRCSSTSLFLYKIALSFVICYCFLS